MLNGIIVIEKEAGFTSHDVVAKMRGICRQKKIGHTGTLDPAATGVLPVCLGSATKLCDMLTQKDKEYVAELLLGVETDTQDTTGCVLTEHEVVATEDEIRRVILGFQGTYAQVPPMYSALKVDGKKLYELARAGKEVERKAREVQIHEIEILEMKLPVVKLRVACSKGTYIRTLCADIGEKLGCGGTMQSLRRTRVGGYRLQEAVTLEKLEQLRDEDRLKEVLIPVDSAFSTHPALHVRTEWRKLLDNGNAFYASQTVEQHTYQTGEWVRVYWEDGKFAGVYAYEASRKWYKPVKMFPEQI
ncbi:MAG: tRNA pseudouridine(55) synthase TruB [Lachnospiraceae bacterium]|nr:tRNA pseudouridine(55) synthase TruB [Lachnospiraceae bacterium]